MRDEPSAATPEELVEIAARRARLAAPVVAALSTRVKNALLNDIAQGVLDEADFILAANERDVEAAERARMPDPLLDRVILTRPRLAAIADGVREVAAFADPVGEVLRGSRRPNGLLIREVRVPLGVVGVIYESRPDVTIDAISLCLKAGNAIVLRGGADVQESNRALLEVVRRAIRPHGIPDGAIELIESTHPRATEHLLHLKEYVDVLIPRGSPALIRHVCGSSTLPTIETGTGNCHVFVERTARLEMAADIAFNAKVQRPGAVNSMETLLVDEPIAGEFLPPFAARMQAAGVELRGCERCRELCPSIRPATEEDWYTEYLDLILAVRVVAAIDEAITHISRYGTHLSEAIVTQDYFAARRFCERVDSAAVYVNASTRFTDGYELGLGAELGISTQKLHRRGPISLRALTTWKWIVQGDGQVRD